MLFVVDHGCLVVLVRKPSLFYSDHSSDSVSQLRSSINFWPFCSDINVVFYGCAWHGMTTVGVYQIVKVVSQATKIAGKAVEDVGLVGD